MEHNIYYLYAITNILNNKVYVGQTVAPSRRWKDHQWLSKNKPEQYVHRAIAKYGVNNFIFSVIDFGFTQSQIDCLEINYIKQYNSCNDNNGYNISPGGDPAWNRGLPKEQQPMYGKKQSEFFMKRMSEVHTGKVIVVSNETRNKISEAMLGRILTQEWKDKISVAQIGKTLSKETIKKMSEAKIGDRHVNYGKHLSKDTRQKISQSHLGKIVSEETRLKQSLIQIGRRHTEETKRKMSVAQKGKIRNNKLTWEIISQIRIEYRSSPTAYVELAKKYNVSASTIERIIKNKTWIIK